MGPLAEYMKGSNVAFLYESTLYPEVRLLTNESFCDTISIGYRFVENPNLMIETFNYFSRGKCFSGIIPKLCALSNQKINKKQGNNRKKPRVSIFDYIPSWFNPKTGASLSQWISVFFESVIMTKYISTVSIESPTSIEDIISPYKKLTRKTRDMTIYWSTVSAEERFKIIKEFLDRESKTPVKKSSIRTTSGIVEICKMFMSYMIANTNSYKFIDSLYFIRLDITYLPILDFIENLVNLINEKYRQYIISTLENDPATLIKQSAIVSKIFDNSILNTSSCLDCYRTKSWDSMKNLDCYKHFFELDVFDPYYLPKPDFEDPLKPASKKHKKKKKHKKSEQSKITDNTSEANTNDKLSVASEIKSTSEILSDFIEPNENLISQNDIIIQENIIKSDNNENKQHETLFNNEKVPEMSSETIINPIQTIQKQKSPIRQRCNTTDSEKINSPTKIKKKPEKKAYFKNMKNEYEMLKKSAIKLFEEKTICSSPPINKNIKEKKKEEILNQFEINDKFSITEPEEPIKHNEFQKKSGKQPIKYRKKVSEQNSPQILPLEKKSQEISPIESTVFF